MKGKPEIWRALRDVGLTTAISRLRLRAQEASGALTEPQAPNPRIEEDLWTSRCCDS